MAKKINSLTELAQELENKSWLFQENARLAVAQSAVKVQSTAKLKFGVYQEGVGGFPAWEALADSTVAQKERAGGSEDPLIGHYVQKTGGGAGGELRNSVLTQIEGLSAVVGTNNKVGTYQEFGTARIPPRPFLRSALYQEQSFIKMAFRKAIIDTMSGR
jgi:phage gpG-like protein